PHVSPSQTRGIAPALEVSVRFRGRRKCSKKPREYNGNGQYGYSGFSRRNLGGLAKKTENATSCATGRAIVQHVTGEALTNEECKSVVTLAVRRSHGRRCQLRPSNRRALSRNTLAATASGRSIFANNSSCGTACPGARKSVPNISRSCRRMRNSRPNFR